MMAENLTVAYAVLGVYLLLVLGCGVLGAALTWFKRGTEPKTGMVRGPQATVCAISSRIGGGQGLASRR